MRIIAHTIKSEVAKQSRQHVHDEHGEDGQVGDVLHFSPAAAANTAKRCTINEGHTMSKHLL